MVFQEIGVFNTSLNDTGGIITDALSPVYGLFGFILRIVGGVIAVYILYLILSFISNMRKNRFLKIISKNVQEINEKMDTLLSKNKNKKK